MLISSTSACAGKEYTGEATETVVLVAATGGGSNVVLSGPLIEDETNAAHVSFRKLLPPDKPTILLALLATLIGEGNEDEEKGMPGESAEARTSGRKHPWSFLYSVLMTHNATTQRDGNGSDSQQEKLLRVEGLMATQYLGTEIRDDVSDPRLPLQECGAMSKVRW